MEYRASYGINCGVSHGFGLKDSDYVELTEQFSEENDNDALRISLIRARKFADDYLSDPETGLTTVRLLSLVGPNGNVSFDSESAVVKRSVLEHLLTLNQKSS